MPDESAPNYDPNSATIPMSGPRPTLSGRDVDLPLPEELAKLLPFGSYEVTHFLGAGGMGAVYKGTQIRLKRPVAIKIMRRDMGKDHDFEARFEREAQAMAKLNHPNIISVIDFGEAGPDYLFIVMELVDGTDLMEVIRSKQMTQEMALTLLPQICDALQFAHDHGIVHRDIKPSNIMLTRDGRVKMADFGLAKHFDLAESGFRTQTGTGMGTPDYAAPEQFDPTTQIDHRADIYALGVMIYQMITGALPRGVWRPPSQRAEVAPQWDNVVSRAMQNDPADRYQQASEVKTELSTISLTQGRAAAPSAAERSAETLLRPQSKDGAAANNEATGRSARAPVKSRTPLVFGIVTGIAVIAAAAFFTLKKPTSNNGGTQTASGAASSPKPAVTVTTEWTDLIPHIDPARDAVRGDWKSGKDGLACVNLVKWSLCRFPVQPPAGDYEVRYKLTRTGGPVDGLFFPFTYGNAAGSVAVDYPGHMRVDGKRRVALQLVQGTDLEKPSDIVALRDEWIPFGKTCTVLLQVGAKEVRVLVDEVEAIRWQADWSKIRQSNAGYPWAPVFAGLSSPIFGVGMFNSEVVFRSIEIRRAGGAVARSSSSSPTTTTKDAPFVNTLGMKFVPVPITGGPTDKQRVLFSIWETRVRDYESFITEKPRSHRPPSFAQTGDHPVGNITWADAVAFCAWLTERERKEGAIPSGISYRLPSDHEWSCAAGIGELEDPNAPPVTKAGKASAFPWGSSYPPPDKTGNFLDEDASGFLSTNEPVVKGYRDGFIWTAPAGSFRPNPLGLYDMSGNVAEYCMDWFDPESADRRVLRGGHFSQANAIYLRSSSRDKESVNGWFAGHGFRIVLGPPLPDSLQIPNASQASTTVADPASTTKDSPFTNTLGMKFVPVPNTMALFSIWHTRVQDYAEFAKAQEAAGKKMDTSWKRLDYEGVPVGRKTDHPVVSVSWEDAQAFCQWLTAKETAEGKLARGQRYRLPTDEEWSWAAGLPQEQGSTPQEKNRKNDVDYPWGKEWPQPAKAGNYADETFHAKFPPRKDDKDGQMLNGWTEGYTDGFATTSPVGSFPANAFGLHDMGGNVWQWCEDWFDESKGEAVRRGASWRYFHRRDLYSATRSSNSTTAHVSDIGFRCVLELAPTGTSVSSSSIATATKADDRVAALMVLGKGGTATILEGGKQRTVKNLAELPERPFEVVELRLERRDGQTTLPLSGEEMQTLAGLAKLERLILQGTTLHDADLVVLRMVPRLTKAYLANNPNLTDEAVTHLAGLDQLTLLHLSNCPGVGSAGVLHLASLQNLEALNLATLPKLDDKALPALTGLRKIRVLALNSSEGVTPTFIESLAVLPELKNLSLSPSQLAAPVALGRFPAIKVMRLSGKNSDPLPATLWRNLAEVPAWDRLELSNLTLSEAHFAEIAGLPALSTLALEKIQLPATGLAVLQGSRITSVETTSADTRFDAAALRSLIPVKSLRSVKIAPGSPITAAGIAEFQKARPDVKVQRAGDSNADQEPATEADNESTSASPAAATKDAPFTNTLGMKFVPVPITGGPTDKQRVLFSIWETRVQDYEAFVKETKRPLRKATLEQGPTHPAVMLSWDDATAFCGWLTERERKEGKLDANECYRLPTDHEWSCAVGIGDREDPSRLPHEKNGKIKDAFPWGTTWPPPPGAGNYYGGEERTTPKSNTTPIEGFADGFEFTAPVGSFTPNRHGLFDLGGNVSEWCVEMWEMDRPAQRHVMRGRSWADGMQSQLLSSGRSTPGTDDPFHISLGFRVVLGPPLPVSFQISKASQASTTVADPASATKDAPFVNTLGMKFVTVPITGGPTDGQHVLFSIWETRAQDYEVFVTEMKREWQKPGFEQGPTHPAVNVSWDDAQAFCAWLTERERKAGTIGTKVRYRLPSDHEWSCAVGIGDKEDSAMLPGEKHAKLKTEYPWRGQWPPPADTGNFSGEETLGREINKPGQLSLKGYRDAFVATAPVGSFRPELHGIFDLSGNVWEWCEDWFDPSHTHRVLRGNAWDGGERGRFLSSSRTSSTPVSCAGAYGFRCVLELAPTGTSVSPSPNPPVSKSSVAAATKDAPFVNSLGMKFVPVPITGGPTNGQRVLFSIWETRVQDYEAFVKETNLRWPTPDFAQGPTHPAMMTTWEDATVFCGWLTERERKTGKLGPQERYRLPSDHEWSCAVGIGDKEDAALSPEAKDRKISGFLWGGEWPPPKGAGNFSGTDSIIPTDAKHRKFIEGYEDGFERTAPVGSFTPSPLGLFDLIGNATEWCDDWYDVEGSRRLGRGSSWWHTTRVEMSPSFRQPYLAEARGEGFRCVLELAPSGAAVSSSPSPPVSKSSVATATKASPFVNTLGMKFVPVPITGGPTNGQRVLFSIWEARVQDYEAFATETKRKWENPDFEQGATHPATTVSWNDAAEFCAWLTVRERQAGKIKADEVYRLPGDHEWSCAAGIGGKETPEDLPRDKMKQNANALPWGDAWPPPDNTGNFWSEELRPLLEAGQFSRLKPYVRGTLTGYRDGYATTAPVGSFTANSFGLHDLSGNAWEFCQDWIDASQNSRVMRGGCWNTDRRDQFSLSYRSTVLPNDRIDRGFRVVLAPATIPSSPLSATKDVPFENTLGMKFVPVPITGGPTDGKRVLFSVWETRVRDYEAFVKEVKRSARPVDFQQGADHPAVNVRHAEAVEFCTWLTERDRKSGAIGPAEAYRLPSDHEWSCAAGIGNQEDATSPPSAKNWKVQAFPWGGDHPPPAGAGNYYGTETKLNPAMKEPSSLVNYDDRFPRTAPVGSFATNSLGLHDLGGNVWEWCEGWFEPGKTEKRVLRGASWAFQFRNDLLSSARYDVAPDYWNLDVGFRVVLAPR